MTEPFAPPTAVLDAPETWGPEHHRDLRWHDPAATLALAATMNGRDYLTAMGEGRLPPSPVAVVAGMEVVHIEDGDVLFRCIPDGSFLNPVGLIHGGLISTLLDSACGCALQTTLPAGTGYSSIELKVSFMRPVQPGDGLLVHGWVVKPGRRVAFTEATLTSFDEKLIAKASSSLAVIAGG